MYKKLTIIFFCIVISYSYTVRAMETASRACGQEVTTSKAMNGQVNSVYGKHDSVTQGLSVYSAYDRIKLLNETYKLKRRSIMVSPSSELVTQ